MKSLELLESTFEEGKPLITFAVLAKQDLITKEWLEQHLNLSTTEAVSEMNEENIEEEWLNDANMYVVNLMRTFKETYKTFDDEEYTDEFPDEFLDRWHKAYSKSVS